MGRVLANRFLTEAGSCQEVFNPVGEPVRGRGGCIARPLRGFPEFAYRMGRARNSRCRPVGSRAQTAGPVFPHSVRKLRRAQADPPPPHRPTHLISTSIGTRLMTATGSICRGVPVRRDAALYRDIPSHHDIPGRRGGAFRNPYHSMFMSHCLYRAGCVATSGTSAASNFGSIR